MELDITADITVLCRVCMIAEAEHLTSLHETSSCEQPSLYVMLEAICAPVFGKSDVDDIIPDLPTKVCLPCRNAIIAAYKLHQQCIDTDQRLNELLALKWELQGPGGEEDVEYSDHGVKTIKEEPTPDTVDAIEENEIDFSKQDEVLDDGDAQLSSGIEESEVGKAMDEEEEKADEHHNSGGESNTENKINCPRCDKVFSSRETLSRHSIRYCDGTNDPKKRTCGICHKVLPSVRILERHMQIHDLSGTTKYQKAQPVAYSCTICDEKFDKKYKLQCHVYGHKEFLTCLNCNRTFKHRAAVLYHMKLKRCPIDPEKLQCENCATTFSSKMSWKRHIEEGNCHQSTFPCTVCGKVFDKPTRLYYHMYSHKGRTSCPNCNHTFAHKGGLMEHIKHKRCPKLKNATQEQEVREELPEAAGTFPCTFCSKTFQVRSRLQNHLNGHIKRAVCPRCDETFSTKGALRLHLDRKRCRMLQKVPAVTKEEPKNEDSNASILSKEEKQKRKLKMTAFPCTICGKIFDNRSKWSYHKASHRERLVCSRCNQTFITSGALRTHIDRKRCPMLKNTPNEIARSEINRQTDVELIKTELLTPEESKEELKSKDCTTTVSSKKEKQKKRKQTMTEFPCTICGKTFDKYSKWFYHKSSHKERVVCSRCNQTFITNSALRTHIARNRCPMLRNTSKKSYVVRSENMRGKEDTQCDKCHMAFTSRRALISHIEEQKCNQTAETFTCTICSKMFDKRTRLQYHLIRHKEPIVCPNACGQTFTTNATLRKHIIHQRCPTLEAGSSDRTIKSENLTEERDQDEEDEMNEMLVAAERELANENITEVMIKVEEPEIEDSSLVADEVKVKLEQWSPAKQI